MLMKILKCEKCSRYTMKKECPKCGASTVSTRPPKFSLEDKYGKYRRLAKKVDNNGNDN